MLDLLLETGMLGDRPADTHMDPNIKITVDQGEVLNDPGTCNRLTGN